MHRWLGLGIVALAVIVGLVSWRIVARVADAFAGAAAIHDAAVLPEHIRVCGRSWHRDALDRRWTTETIRTTFAVEPVVVDPGPFSPCSPGACTDVAMDAPCHTVIFVRVGEDAYVDYALQGGP